MPLVELATNVGQRWITDSNGVIAIEDAALLGRDKVFFHVRTHGYEFPKNGFGARGTTLTVIPGKRTTLEVNRTQFAERLYRATGANIYGDSVRESLAIPFKQSLLSSNDSFIGLRVFRSFRRAYSMPRIFNG